MSMKNRVGKLERAAGGGYLVAMPMYLNAEGEAEKSANHADDDVRAISFLCWPSGFLKVLRDEGEQYDDFVRRAHLALREKFSPTTLVPRGGHQV